MKRAAHTTSATSTYRITDDHRHELSQAHGDAVHMAAALRFLDTHADGIDDDSEDGLATRGGFISLLTILATASQALADRIETLEHAIAQTAEGGAR
jgi:hypothetical protein